MGNSKIRLARCDWNAADCPGRGNVADYRSHMARRVQGSIDWFLLSTRLRRVPVIRPLLYHGLSFIFTVFGASVTIMMTT